VNRAASPAAAPRLRVALLLDSWTGPAWTQRLVSELQTGGDAEIALVVLDDTLRPERGFLARAWHGHASVAYGIFTAIDAALYGRPDDAFVPCALEPLLRNVPVARLQSEGTAGSKRLADSAIEASGRQPLDVVLDLGTQTRGRDVVGLARHGVWSLGPGDAPGKAGMVGFWEVADGARATAISLQCECDGTQMRRVLHRAWSSTDPRSVRQNRSELLWKGAALFGRALRELRRSGSIAGEADLPAAPMQRQPARSERSPSNRETLGAAARIGRRALRDRAQSLLYRQQWALAVSAGPSFPPAPERFRQVLPPKDRLWADPFPFEHEGRCVVFLEECLFADSRAHLSVMEITPDGRFTTPRTVLERPYHLSYPFVFAWNREIWMLPETSENGTVELYRCEAFPDRWTLDRVLLDGIRGADATLHQQDGRWWMFLSVAVAGARTFDDLHVYHAETPLGPWQPLAANPVLSDVRCARPAGRLFPWEGGWIRPVQDGSGAYGRAIRFERVERLDADGYAESEAYALEPGWSSDVLATHTWNSVGALTVIDFVKRRPRFW
jgi:hypothetical protein